MYGLADVDVGGAVGGRVLDAGDDELAGLFGEAAEGGAGGGGSAARNAFEGVEDGEGPGSGEGEREAVADAEVGVGFKGCDGGWLVDGNLDA